MTKSRVDDALSSLAPLLRVRPELQGICRFGDDWESWHDAAQPGWAYFHIVVQGECLIDRPGHATMRRKAGDILLLPHGSAHLTRGRIGVGHPSPPIAIEYRNGVRTKTSMGVVVTTELICGRLHFEQASEGLLSAALPEVVVVSTENRLVMDRFCAPPSGGLRKLRHTGRFLHAFDDVAAEGGVLFADLKRCLIVRAFVPLHQRIRAIPFLDRDALGCLAI